MKEKKIQKYLYLQQRGNLSKENDNKGKCHCGVVVITTAQLHPTKSKLKFCTGSKPARSMLEICDGENL